MNTSQLLEYATFEILKYFIRKTKVETIWNQREAIWLIADFDSLVLERNAPRQDILTVKI